ncbi:MAG: sortase [Candidatus Levyibacteriota bacterium]
MPKKYYTYQTKGKLNSRKIIRFFGLIIFLCGFLAILYVFFPLISWQIFFAPIFASQDIAAPIPKTTIVNSSSITSLFSQATDNLGTNYLDAQTWFPGYKSRNAQGLKTQSYIMSIPTLGIKNANVTTIDNDLEKHLVNYGGTAIPPDNGTAVIFGHSTLPQLFNSKDYKTIFATVYKLKIGDEFSVNVNGVTYIYKIYNIIVTDPSDNSIFTQDFTSSYIALVTCTPPGTTWKRLIIKAKLAKI